MRVLLTGARAPVTLDLARHFDRMGHEVYLADSLRLPLARLSRVAKRTFYVARPSESPKLFIENLVGIARQWQIDWIIPTCEEIFFLAANLKAFEGVCHVFCEPLDVLRTLHNKWEFANLVQSLGDSVTSPESHLIESPEQLLAWSEGRELDEWVLKPVYSRFASKTLIAPRAEQLGKLSPDSDQPWLAQKRVRGTEYSTYSIVHRGAVLAHTCYRSKYRAGLGAGIYFTPISHSPIQKFVHEFASKQNFTGQIGFDFMEDQNGQVFVLECNPRATSGVHMLHGQPVADAILGTYPQCIEPLNSTPCMVAIAMWMVAVPESFRRRSIVTVIRDMLRARDIVFSWSDPMPSLLSPFTLIEIAARAFKERMALTEASTRDIEWNGSEV